MIKKFAEEIVWLYLLDGETAGSSLPQHDENEEEMLRRAIAMSLEGQEEELPIRTGLILKDDIAKS